MSTTLDAFFKEERHIFGVCPNPECRSISRFTDLRVSYRSKYVKDWLDEVEDELASWEQKTSNLKDRQKDLKQKSIDEARRTILPKKLRAISPLFQKRGIQPEDIKVVSHPVDFIAFDGLITAESLKRVVLLESVASGRLRSGIENSIKRAVDNDKYDWSVLRVDENGVVTQE
jgi:predicted Holliday junction resolvase-like endonuclease